MPTTSYCSSGSGGGGLTLVPGSAHPDPGDCEDLLFTIENNSGANITLSSLKLTWSAPTAYYEEIKWDVNGTDTKVFDSENPRAASGDISSFSPSQTITNGSQIELEIKNFQDLQSGGGAQDVNINNTTFTILFSDGSTFDIPVGACQ